MRLLCDKKPTLNLTVADCISLELKLNVTSKAHEWGHIGQLLFEYGTKKTNALETILLDQDEYDFLKLLLSRSSWTDCTAL